MALLQRGLRGEPVVRLQKALNVDGIAGPDTFSHMGLYELIIMNVGSRGECVKKLQQQLKLDADGIFGKGTRAAVQAFQQANGLNADGIVGPETLAKMDLFEEVDDAVVERAQLPADFKLPEPPPALAQSASAEDKREMPAAVAEIAEQAQESGLYQKHVQLNDFPPIRISHPQPAHRAPRRPGNAARAGFLAAGKITRPAR